MYGIAITRTADGMVDISWEEREGKGGNRELTSDGALGDALIQWDGELKCESRERGSEAAE